MRQTRHPLRRVVSTLTDDGSWQRRWRTARRPFERLRHAATEQPAVLDALLATALLVAAVIGLSGEVPEMPGLQSPDPITYVITIIGIIPYYFRRRTPLLVLLIAVVPLMALIQRDNTPGALGAGAFILAYTVAAWCDRRRMVIAVFVIAVLIVVIWVSDPTHMSLTEFVTNAVLFTGAFVFGQWAQTRRRYIGWVEERAALLERDRERDARQAVAEERVRIAQDLHDVVAHSMGVIAVQAGTGLHVIDDQPEEAKRSLAAISGTSRAALTEIRRILGALRSSDDRDDPGAGYAPTPSLADLDRLTAELTSAGLDTTLQVVGERGDIPLGIDLAAYRVAQEALTNALKHAPGSTVEVLVRYEPGAVIVTVTDNGPADSTPPGDGGPAPGTGHGLIGMRERVTAWGGTLQVGPVPAGGFRVAARIPYGEPS